MKKVLSIFIYIIFSTASFAQIENMQDKSWKVNMERTNYGNSVFRIEGNNDIGGVTNIGYQTLEQYKTETISMANKQMWTEEQKTRQLNAFDNFAQGGIIHLYISRLTIDAANSDNFTIIVKDSSETEIIRRELKEKIAQTPIDSEYWWNTGALYIPQKIHGLIYIYVIDKLSRDNARFKFSIKI